MSFGNDWFLGKFYTFTGLLCSYTVRLSAFMPFSLGTHTIFIPMVSWIHSTIKTYGHLPQTHLSKPLREIELETCGTMFVNKQDLMVQVKKNNTKVLNFLILLRTCVLCVVIKCVMIFYRTLAPRCFFVSKEY